MQEQGKTSPLLIVSFVVSCLLSLSVLIACFYVFQDRIFPVNPIEEKLPYDRLYRENLNLILDDTSGNIPILEYHIIETPAVAKNLISKGKIRKNRKTERFFVTTDELRNHLETLYTNGFRNISLNEYLSLMKDSKKSLDRLGPGNRLYCITFDDATYGQFDVMGTDVDGKPVIDPDCAVGVMLEMSRKHPDFPLNAAFCVDFENTPFTDEKTFVWKLNRLADLGFEIVNHTRSHSKLSRYFPANPKAAAYEIGSAMELFRKYIGDKADRIDKICYPDGRSNPQVWKFVRSFTYNGREYRFTCAFDAKGYQAKNPNDPRFNPYNIARIETSKFSFDPFILNAKNLYTLPAVADLVSNKPGLLTGSVINTELIRLD